MTKDVDVNISGRYLASLLKRYLLTLADRIQDPCKYLIGKALR